MKLFKMVYEQEYFGLSDEELIALNRSDELTGIPYFALQQVLSERGLNTNRIVEIEKENSKPKRTYRKLLNKWCSNIDLSFIFGYRRNIMFFSKQASSLPRS